MLESLRRLASALVLVVLASLALLLSDRAVQGNSAAAGGAVTPGALPRLVILQHSSTALMDAILAGVESALAEAGLVAPEALVVEVMNPQGDLATASTMAQRIAGGNADVVLTISTPMLQVMAGANRKAHRRHVFVGVSDPVAAGVGIEALDSLSAKPVWLTGIGTLQPVEEIFRLAREINPRLAVVGVVWNPAEINSEICTRRARAISAELGIKLIEAPIEKTSDVREATAALVQRGAEAIWTGGDATVAGAIDPLVAAARQGGVPVFSNMAGQVHSGTLFDYGADYETVGHEGGRIAALVLHGADPATIPVHNFMPERMLLNDRARLGLRQRWDFPAAVRTRARSVIDAEGTLIERPRENAG